MRTLHFNQTTTSTPEPFIAALTGYCAVEFVAPRRY
jgi:hypothetical protein